jgi:hypothetical protein
MQVVRLSCAPHLISKKDRGPGAAVPDLIRAFSN